MLGRLKGNKVVGLVVLLVPVNMVDMPPFGDWPVVVLVHAAV
jgi:hypothetical protein